MRLLRGSDHGPATRGMPGMSGLPAQPVLASYPGTGGMRTLDAIFWLVILLMLIHIAEVVLLVNMLRVMAGH
jgi:hypothetical protein